jgi:hypothetical protein
VLLSVRWQATEQPSSMKARSSSAERWRRCAVAAEPGSRARCRCRVESAIEHGSLGRGCGRSQAASTAGSARRQARQVPPGSGLHDTGGTIRGGRAVRALALDPTKEES